MLKVNEEKILREYNDLLAKRKIARANIAAAAKSFAMNRGYGEEKTADFVAYVLDTENDGLSASESDKLEFLSDYIDEVPDEVQEAQNGEVVY